MNTEAETEKQDLSPNPLVLVIMRYARKRAAKPDAATFMPPIIPLFHETRANQALSLSRTLRWGRSWNACYSYSESCNCDIPNLSKELKRLDKICNIHWHLLD